MKRKYKDLRKVAVDQGNYYATGCLLSDPYLGKIIKLSQ